MELAQRVRRFGRFAAAAATIGALNALAPHQSTSVLSVTSGAPYRPQTSAVPVDDRRERRDSGAVLSMMFEVPQRLS